ncbi:MAG: hypothetical protein H7Z41_05580 [Cytophagales bacterium]|nr:hypothetical protein [Armatimonadota bacterium]
MAPTRESMRSPLEDTAGDTERGERIVLGTLPPTGSMDKRQAKKTRVPAVIFVLTAFAVAAILLILVPIFYDVLQS